MNVFAACVVVTTQAAINQGDFSVLIKFRLSTRDPKATALQSQRYEVPDRPKAGAEIGVRWAAVTSDDAVRLDGDAPEVQR